MLFRSYWMNHYDRNSLSDMELLYMEVEKFARWLVQNEREECAKLCDEKSEWLALTWRKGLKANSHLEGMSDGADECATAIRGRE